MTKAEFNGQFDRLCKGLEYVATTDQREALYRRTHHVALSVWAEAVTTCLCDGRKGFLPKLEHVLAVLDAEAERQRVAAVARDRVQAERITERLAQPVDETEQSRIPTPGTPLFACIKAYAARHEARKRLTRLQGLKFSKGWSDMQIDRENQRLSLNIQQAERDIAQYSPLIHDDDAARLVRDYETERP